MQVEYSQSLLADLAQRSSNIIIMAIPCGGAPVVCRVALRYNILIDLVICRKKSLP